MQLILKVLGLLFSLFLAVHSDAKPQAYFPQTTKLPINRIDKIELTPKAMTGEDSSPHPSLKIIQKPIIFDEIRKKLSQEYIQMHYGIKPPVGVNITPQIIVIHATEIPTFSGSFRALYPAVLSKTRKELSHAGMLNVSAHFLVDRDGTIYQLLPESIFARHTIGLNLEAIGIENVGGTKETPLTPAQLQANVALVRFLKKKYAIRWLISHAEYGRFRGSKLWRELDPHYFTFKTDPEPTFMKALREQVKDLSLLSNPN